MNEPANVLRGVLHPDGTLELAGRPSLPAGEVEVTIRPVAGDEELEGYSAYLRRIRAEREAAGHPSRTTKEEIDAELASDRDWGEDRLDQLRAEAEAPAEPAETSNGVARGDLPGESLWRFMQRSRAELEASGHRFRTKEEIDADLEEMRDWDGRIEEIRRQGEDTGRDDSR